MEDPVQEIKGKLSIEDIVASYLPLKQAGKYMKACCPFHQEKTPSFYVSAERQIAYCFSCQKGGDMFEFIREIEGVDFRGALEILAEKAGVELKKNSTGPRVSKDEKDRLKSANSDASKFFVQELYAKGAGEKVLAYLKSRAVSDETLKVFQVGFAPGDPVKKGDVLYRHLLEKGHKKNDLLTSSLVVARDAEQAKVIDRFNLRLVFPIDNTQGDVIGFGGRALKKGDNPKYLNSSEYVLYHKGSTLYNLSRAKAAIREEDFVVAVEGYFDVMASYQAGVKNVVATSGTALGDQQFKLLKRYTKKVVLAFDQDNAGQDALLRAVKVAQPLGVELFVVVIPEGKDTADAVKEDPKLWIDAVDNRKPYLAFYADMWRKELDLATVEGKHEFSDRFLDLLSGVSHPVDRDHFLKELSKWVGTPIDMLYDYLNQMSHSHGGLKKRKKTAEKVEKELKTKKERLFVYFLSLLLAFPKEFFEAWALFQKYEEFSSAAQNMGLIKQLNKLNVEAYESFRNDFEDFLIMPGHEISASAVYKQVRDYYNSHAVLDEAFYADLDEAEKLKKMAFAVEIENNNVQLVKEEFEKLITLLYFEFSS
jgi:DNA primase